MKPIFLDGLWHEQGGAGSGLTLHPYLLNIIEFNQMTEHRAVQKTDKYSPSAERGRQKTLGGL